MGYRILFECISNMGRIRKINQDNFLCDAQMLTAPLDAQVTLSGEWNGKSPMLFGVFDGMGGEEQGEVASYLAASHAATFAFSKPKQAIAELKQLCFRMNTAICEYTQNNHVLSMGTTAAMLLFDRKRISLCNIGDSKIFLFSHGNLTQISEDHTMVSAFGTKPRLTQNLGIPPTELIIEPYFAQGCYQRGDRYLLCSDGLTDMVSNEQIADILQDADLHRVAESLLQTALDNGGKDNITLLLCEIAK